jgi:hypothetical protein
MPLRPSPPVLPRRSPLVQLALPLPLPDGTPTTPAVPGRGRVLVPKQVWTGLSPPDRARVQQTLIAVLQEVVHGRNAS